MRGLLSGFGIELCRQVEVLELQIKLWHKENEASQKLEVIPGVGPITASAIVATIGKPQSIRVADNWQHGWG